MEDEPATLQSQFLEFAKFFDHEKKRDGSTITLYRSDYWMRQAKIIDDRKITMTDTGLMWFKFCKTELNYEEWMEFLNDLCEYKDLEYESIAEDMTNCGDPGTANVYVPQYRDFFDTFVAKTKTLF